MTQARFDLIRIFPIQQSEGGNFSKRSAPSLALRRGRGVDVWSDEVMKGESVARLLRT